MVLSCLNSGNALAATKSASKPRTSPPVESVGSPVESAQTTEDWKGTPSISEMDAGFLLGMGVLDSSAGFALLGTFSKKIVHQGFVPEINNSVSLEVQAGPLFVSSATAFAYSLHLRWDFTKDSDWTFYSLAGVAGHITGEDLGSRFLLFPRVGLGAFHSTSLGFLVRGEISHEFLTVGLTWPF